MIILDLPPPPSTNRLWAIYGDGASKRLGTTLEYKAWQKAADAALMMAHALRGVEKITGPFKATIELQHIPAADLDNRAKGPLDYAQRIEVISNDRNCRELHMRWVGPDEAPQGCRLKLEAL